MRVADLPQGVMPPKSVQEEVENEGPAYPTVIQQARNNMQKFANRVVLTRVGSFYEVSSALLGIELAAYFEI